MKRKDAGPTMKDVAREAGVALGTVSRVFNGFPVGASYRRRVEAAAERLGYRLNSYARGLKTSRTHTAALLLPGIADPLHAALAEEVCKALARRDYRTMLALSHGDLDEERRNVRLMEQHSVDGIIGIACDPNLRVEGIPFVRICDLDEAQCGVGDMPRLAENCAMLLLWEGRDAAPTLVRVDGVTLERREG